MNQSMTQYDIILQAKVYFSNYVKKHYSSVVNIDNIHNYLPNAIKIASHHYMEEGWSQSDYVVVIKTEYMDIPLYIVMIYKSGDCRHCDNDIALSCEYEDCLIYRQDEINYIFAKDASDKIKDSTIYYSLFDVNAYINSIFTREKDDIISQLELYIKSSVDVDNLLKTLTISNEEKEDMSIDNSESNEMDMTLR
jgi:hypothetical protein